MTTVAKELLSVSLENEMRHSYLDYAMSVIVGRALPDVRDGLKPVHRRVLYAMDELGNAWNKAYKKSARIVGDVIGKYHPHGDTAVYDTIVRMAQSFSMRYPLIDGQGNFGSIDGDNAAAMRYTEIRMSRIAHELLADIDKETVDFGPNYDGSEHEPLIMPTRVPNLLINGSSGIAVGMATNIPPHNLGEVIDGALALLANSELTIDDLLQYIPAPDFPTAAMIYGTSGVIDGYRTGRGRVVMRARTHFEDLDKGGKQAIIIDELPYQVNKARLCEKIAELVRDKKIEGISDLRDESDKSGMRVYIELKRGEMPAVVLNHLFKHTPMQDTFGINMVALINGQPKTLNLKEILRAFLEHRHEVVIRRTRFELRKARERGHILEGLAVALSNIDPIIALIKQSPDSPTAKAGLLANAWPSPLVAALLERSPSSDVCRPATLEESYGFHDGSYRLSDVQAQAILDLRLHRLTGLEQDKITKDYATIVETILDLMDILARPERVTSIIEAELQAIKAQYADPRRSEIITNSEDINIEDLITPEDRVVTMSHSGYIKSQAVSEYRAQKRGGRGKQAASTREDDFVERMFVTHSHNFVLCFSSRGVVYWLKVYELPHGNRTSRGKPINNLLPLQDGEKINAILPVTEFRDDHFVFMTTSKGVVKKTPLSDFSRPRSQGIIALNLDDGDRMIGVAITDGKHDVMLFSDAGKVCRFNEEEVRSMGRTARGVRGMRMGEDHTVIGMFAVSDESQVILTVSENGYGKRTRVSEYTRHGRGTQGILAMQTTKKTGRLVTATPIEPESDVMLITQTGVMIRTPANKIREASRVTQGVMLMRADELGQDKLVSVATVAECDDEDIENGVEDCTDGLDL
ncbi:MAG: DNA gyrase subunit A [Pseudomonadota bacterium]